MDRTSRPTSLDRTLCSIRRELDQLGLGFCNSLGDSTFEPLPRFAQIPMPCGTGPQIASEHELRLAMAELGGGAKPMFGEGAVFRDLVATAVHCPERKHRAAMSFGRGLLTQLERRRWILRPAAPVHEHLGQRHLAIRDPGLGGAGKPFARSL